MGRPNACSASKHVTTETAARALYLDFEGPGQSPGSSTEPAPVLAGVRCEGDYECTVLDERFADAAAAVGARVQPMPEFLAGLLERAHVEGRRIAFWSSHEAQVFAANGLELGEVALDVRPAARKLFPGRFKAARAARSGMFRAPRSQRTTMRVNAYGLLAHCAGDAGLPAPHGYGHGLVGKRLRHALTQAEAKPDYRAWSPGAKHAWTMVLKHNQHDCLATQHLLEFVARREE